MSLEHVFNSYQLVNTVHIKIQVIFSAGRLNKSIQRPNLFYLTNILYADKIQTSFNRLRHMFGFLLVRSDVIAPVLVFLGIMQIKVSPTLVWGVVETHSKAKKHPEE